MKDTFSKDGLKMWTEKHWNNWVPVFWMSLRGVQV